MTLFEKTLWVRMPRPLKILAALYAVYLALVLLIATPLLNYFAPKIYREQTGRELQLGKTIWLNPFTLTLNVRDASSAPNSQNTLTAQNKEADHSRLWSFDALTINVSLASVWRGHVVLDALELRGLALQIEQTAPARFNFSDILDYRAKHFPPQPANAEADSKPIAIEIKRFEFTAKQAGYHATHAVEPVQVAISDLDFTAINLSTVPDKNASSDYEISMRDNSGGSVRIKGSVALTQHSATGSAQLRALNLLPAWQYLADKLAFKAQRAQLDGDINYRVNWGEQLVYQIKDSRLALRNVQLQSRADADTSAAFSALRIEGIALDSAQPQVRIAQVMLEQPVLRGWNRGTKVSLLDMIAFPASDEPSAPSPWHVLIDAIDVADGSVHWHANQLDNRQLTLAPLAIHAANLHWPDAAPLQFNATTDIRTAATANHSDAKAKVVDANTNDAVKVAFDGELVPGDVTGKINGSIAKLPLAWGNTFVQQQMRATIASGTLSTTFAVTLDHAQPTLVQSEGSIDGFELQAQMSAPQIGTDRRKLATCKKMEWRQLELKPTQRRAAIKQIVATQPWAQFRINADGTNNFQQLMNTNSTPAAKTKTEIPTAALPPSPSPPEGRTLKGIKGESNMPWQFTLDNIHIDNATIDFRDASLSSAFRTNITELSGDIDGINSAGEKSSKVGLRGTIDGYAPVALTGHTHLFAATPTLDIALDITNVDLATLTPYSGTYAGYQIDGGRLTVQMTYTLANNRIKGSNHIIVNQMQLGKQVRGPKVMDLPLRFAIYLLTDSDGVMDLGVDVTGNVDDPDFSVGSIIWKALRNLIVKTATSPFRALANITGAGARDDLDRIAFAAGSDQIATGETEKLQTLTTALQKKPALKLSITGHVSPNHDIEALRDNTLSQQLIAQGGINQTDIQQQSKNWQREVIKAFKQHFPEEDNAHWQVMQMNDAMRDNIELAASALPSLAAQRSLAVKQALVTHMGLAADRAFVKPADLGTDKNPGLQATMEVE